MARVLKEIAYRVLVLSGLSWIAARLNQRKSLVLLYHGVYGGALNPVLNFDGLHVRVERFERQMRYLAARYRVVSLDQLLTGEPCDNVGKPRAAITFDDGYRNIYRHAYPVLRRLELPATVFVVTDFLQSGRALWWDRLSAMVASTRCPVVRVPVHGTERQFRIVTAAEKQVTLQVLRHELLELPPQRREALLAGLGEALGAEQRAEALCEPLSPGELREMAQGEISVGSHGCSHDSFLHLSRDVLQAELVESKRVLESVTGRPVVWLCYPYGLLFSGETIEAAIRARYHGAVSTIEGLNDGIPNPYAIRRIGVRDTMTLTQFIVAVSGLRDFLKELLGFRWWRRWLGASDNWAGRSKGVVDVRDREPG